MEKAEKKDRFKVACLDSARSQSPRPDYLLNSAVREYFMQALGEVCASAFLQVMNRGGYNESARRNRERISSDARKRVDRMARLNERAAA